MQWCPQRGRLTIHCLELRNLVPSKLQVSSGHARVPHRLRFNQYVFLPLLAALRECPDGDLQEEAIFREDRFPGGRAALTQLVVEAEERDVPTHRSGLCHG